MQEVERQHYAKLRPENADMFLAMEKQDWASLNSSMPRRPARAQALPQSISVK
jgi:hypothetical protein